MKPISIGFQCFGPYIERQFIDFTAVGGNGLFLICGDTGAGKTTILDAVSCALYNKATDGKRGNMAAMRSEFSPEDKKTEVEFFFTHNGSTYRFYRSLLPKRKAEPTPKNIEEALAQVEQKKEGGITENYHVVFECERQVDGNWIPIWEGSKKGQSANAAKEVLGLSYKQFCQIVILPQGKFETFIMSPSGQKEEILKSLFHTQRWEDAVNKLETAAEEDEKALEMDSAFISGYLAQHKCESVDRLLEKVASAEEQASEAKKYMEAAKTIYEETNRELIDAQRDLLVFADLERTEQNLKELLSEKAEKQEEERLLKKAEEAELLKDEYSLYQEEEKKYKKVYDIYAREVQRQIDLAKKIEEREKLIADVRRKICENYRKIKFRTTQEKEDIGLLIDEFSQICDELSLRIEEIMSGKELPVTPKSSYKEEVKKRADELQEILGALSDELREDLEEERKLAENRGKDAGVKLRFKSTLEGRGEDKEKAYAIWEPFKLRWEAARKEKGFESDEEYRALSLTNAEKTARIRALAQYEERVKNEKNAYDSKLRELKGKTKPDIAELESRTKSLRERYLALEVAYGRIQKYSEENDSLRKVKELQDNIRGRKEHLEKRKTYVKMLKGSNGYGIQRYILGVMLSSVIQEANQILQTVFEGRYTLRRTDEGLGKKGLELAVHSYGEETGRLVKTLSGGEKFIVSLCLAIGLSGVVQAQGGGRVEALFVDEGFGTLDRDRVVDALNILQMTRKHTDMIGIISHVDYLSETIHEKILVQKSIRGSSIRVEM